MTDPIPASAASTPLADIREALTFIAEPRAVRPADEPFSAHLKPLLVLLAVNIAVLFTLLPLLELWNKAMGIETPKLVLDHNSPLLIVAAVAILPPLEELVFRGWQTGKAWQLALLLGGLLTGLAAFMAGPAGAGWLGLPLLGVGAVLTAIAAWTLRGRSETPGWFTRHFRWIFWFTAALFASAHYSNYTGLSWAHAPLVLPQLWAGLLLGFVRLRYGLLRSAALHVGSNALVVAISALTGLAGA